MSSKKAISKSNNKITVIYSSHFEDQEPKTIKIGVFNDEKTTVAGVITWLIETGNGGLDVEYLNDLFFESKEEYKNEKEMIEYLIETYKTWDELRGFCEEYGEYGCGYFECPDGWHLKKILK